ncbi:MAG TPA: hypothetical protein VGN13_05840 [Solirubrobacteraceae bacterium]|jgi:hypothetical protein
MPQTPSNETAATPRRPQALRLPSARASALLAVVMLAVGLAIGAAIGPAPEASLAGGAQGLAQRLPQLAAALAGGTPSPLASTPAHAGTSPASPASPPLPARTAAAPATTGTPAPAVSSPAATQPQASSEPAAEGKQKANSSLPALTTVWLVELAGGTLAEAIAEPAAAPYTSAQLVPKATVLGRWSALDASAFASETALLHPAAPGAAPPLLHSIVQPPCPEGAPTCAPGTAGQLTAADEFLKATLASITATATYREHGLVVVSFASVGIAAQQELPPAASSATLTAQPPGGVLLLSPFARAGASSTPYDPTSPARSLEKLLP